MSNAVFPVLPGWTYSVVKTPSWATRRQVSVSGRELRTQDYLNPRWTFTLTFSLLQDYAYGSFSVNNTPLRTLMDFFNSMGGGYDSFLFDDPTDDSATDQVIGVGDGTTTTFQLVRQLITGGFKEYVTAPNNVTNVSIAGVTQSPSTYYVDQSSGIITFSVAPSSGATITASFTFYFRVEFVSDSQDFEEFYHNMWEMKQLKLRSVLLPDAPASPAPTTGSAVAFDGNTYITSSTNLGLADSPQGLLSIWVKPQPVSKASAGIWQSNTNFLGYGTIESSQVFSNYISDTSSDNADDRLDNVSPTLTNGAWYHLLLAWDTNFNAGSRIFQLAINGSLLTGSNVTLTERGASTPYNTAWSTETSFSFFYGGDINTANFIGSVYDFWFGPGQFLDLTIPSNIEKFISGGAPVDLGSDGSTPTGTAPVLFFHCDFSASPNSFATNLGTGGTTTLSGDDLTLDIAP